MNDLECRKVALRPWNNNYMHVQQFSIPHDFEQKFQLADLVGAQLLWQSILNQSLMRDLKPKRIST